MVSILLAVVCFGLGLVIGWKFRDIRDDLVKRIDALQDKKSFVTNPYVEPKPYNTSTAIISPKTPQQLQNEAFERAKRGEV